MKFYFLDTCAIARYYCNDIGTNIIKQIVDSDSTAVMILDFSTIEIVSALTKMKRENHIGFGDAEFDIALTDFENDINNKVFLVESEPSHYTKAKELIRKYDIDSADALIVAASLIFAEGAASRGHDIVFVTSDKKPYVVAVEESNTRSFYSAFHFWKCKCIHCGNIVKFVKCKKVICPSCNQVICDRCEIVTCHNTYAIPGI